MVLYAINVKKGRAGCGECKKKVQYDDCKGPCKDQESCNDAFAAVVVVVFLSSDRGQSSSLTTESTA
jgi:hypothetical protein